MIAHNSVDSGGIQSVCRMIKAYSDELSIDKVIDLRRTTISLNFFLRVKSLKTLRLLYLSYYVIIKKPETILSTHVNQLKLLRILRVKSKILLICHGGEVWSNKTLKIYEEIFDIRFLAVSEYTSMRIQTNIGITKSKIYRLHLTSDIFSKADIQEFETNIDSFTILTVSRLEKSDRYKGVDTAILAFRDACLEFPNLSMQIIGTGDDLEYYKKLILLNNLESKIELLGYVETTKLIDSYKKAMIFLLPGRPTISENLSEGEGFGIVFIEAGYFGIPSIGGSGDGAAEAIIDRKTGFLVDGRDIKSVSNVIKEITKSRNLRNEMGERARIHALKFHSKSNFLNDIKIALQRSENDV